ncbi:NAD-dependent epimerase/dehydratase family protein [Streptomyces rhizosphaerihabitans]|uniref:NAD-dependent epimerase/dehydratase family protein n=1 Tax=Streptomyces rhizosphaerihabitans TaxID=1266770 RepID=UPI0021C0B1E2|nr:NAD-dependent epimerase/dehydratase family protein [Streptomyces rhizosphaerihabitans]MCT9007401.1 NAD-dependent epimerase/dehydratase family protein [Streptomyces rhizosphaerihabitans]
MWSSTATSQPVLVTGGAGFIGSRLVRSLASAGHHVRVLDDLTTGRPESVDAIPGVTLVRGSVLDPDAVAEAARGTGLVLHLAGVVGMRLAAQQSAYAYAVGHDGTANVLARSGDTPVVLVSSSAVYGLSDSAAVLREDLPLDRAVPLAYDGGAPGYATGKWEMERLGQQAAHQRPVLVVRPFNVVGPGQSGRYGMVLPTFFRQAGADVPLTVHGDGTQRRCFTDIDQFTRRLLDLAASDAAWRPDGNVFNIGSTTETAIGDLARLVLDATGSTAGVVHVPYESVFPGRTDVTGRVPRLDRLTSAVGETDWLSAAALVRKTAQAQQGGAVAAGR